MLLGDVVVHSCSCTTLPLFADAISAGLRAKAADGVSASLAGAGVSQEIIPCLDGTSPLFVVPPFSPVPRGLNAKRAADEVIESFLSPEVRIFFRKESV